MKGGRQNNHKDTHHREFNQQSVLHDRGHREELCDRDPNKGLLKTADCDWGCCTYEDGRGSYADSPDSEGGCPGLSELPRMTKMSPLHVRWV